MLGPERVTAIVVDEGNPRDVLHAFEALVGLRHGTLAAIDPSTNRSLPLPEVEAIRAFNLAFQEAGLGKPLSSKLHGRVMRRGAAASMKARPADPAAPRVMLPTWSRAAVSATADAIVAGSATPGRSSSATSNGCASCQRERRPDQ